MFRNRKDAALQLAEALEKYNDTGVIVLGIPRGGAETGYYVARHLKADFSLIVSRKLGHPENPEFAIGAIAEDGGLYLSDYAHKGIPIDVLEGIIAHQKIEITRRIKMLRKGEPLPLMKDRTVILVDDGIATGSTLFAAISMCKKKGAGKIVVAAPVSGREMKLKLMQLVDEIVILDTPEFYQSVSQAYLDFSNLTDEEALEFMNKWRNEH